MIWPDSGLAAARSAPQKKVVVSAARDLGSSDAKDTRPWAVRIREPVGAVRLAVQILAGPLRSALDQLDDVSRARVRSVLETLEASTRQLCKLVQQLPPTGLPEAANDPPPPLAAPTPSAPPGPQHAVDVDELLGRVEIVTVTRSSLPVLLAVDAREGLKAADPGRDLLATLVALLERAAADSARARPHARPWTLEIRAFVDPAEVLGDDMHVVLEIRHDGTPLAAEVVAWLDDAGPAPSDEPALLAARDVAQRAGGRLEALCAGSKTAIRLRLPESG